MKWRAISIVSMLIMSALFVGAGSSLAAPFTATITLSDWGDNVQDYFEPYEDVYFEVTILDGGGPLQYEWVWVIITNSTDAELFNDTYETSSLGVVSGSWTGGETGNYDLQVSYNWEEIANSTFEIYEPVPWSADCWTQDWEGTEVDEFTESEWIYTYFRIFDQKGNPYEYSFWGDVTFEITHNEWTVDSGTLYTDIDGEDSESYHPSGNSQFGSYTITVYNDADSAIGTHVFSVVLPDRAVVWPQYDGENRTAFTGGERVSYVIHLYYDNTIPYDTQGNAARVLLFHESDMENPLRNNTLDTDSDGVDYEWNFYTIPYDDEHKGTYFIMVYNQTWNHIGTGIFMVIELDIELIPYKDVYSQGDEVQLSVSTSLMDPYTVKITDASHDGISGASWSVPANTPEWLRSFTFPEIEDGTYHVDVLSDGLLLGYMTFELKKFRIEARLSQDYFLPGQSGTLFWRATNNHDGGPISITGETEMSYMDNDFDWVSDALNDLSGSAGSFDFEVPRDAYIGSSGNIYVDAEDDNDHLDSSNVGFQVGGLQVTMSKDRTSYRPGDSVYMTYHSRVSGSNAVVPNVDIKARAQFEGVTQGETWTISTNSNGVADFVYQIPADAKEGLFVIVMNATFDDNRNIKYNGTADFEVTVDPIVSLILYQQDSVYAPGDSVTIPYRVLSDGQETSNAEVSYEAWLNGDTIALGFGSTGTISFRMPADVEGSLSVSATAITSDGTAYDQLTNIQVTNAQLVLFTDKSVYLPGENITWSYVLRGDTATRATYRITDPDGVLLAQGTIINGSFIYKLPENHARDPTARIYITGADENYIEADTANVYQGYLIEFWTLQNSYGPGDIMEINYTIIKIGDVPEVADGFLVHVNIMGEYENSIWVTEETGVIEYQLAEDITDGKHLLMVTLGGTPGALDDFQTIIIDSDAGELAHGTIAGLNAGAFIALILAIVGIIIGLVGVMMARKKKTAATEPAVAETPPPPPPEPVIMEETAMEEPGESYPPETEQSEEGEASDYPPPPNY